MDKAEKILQKKEVYRDMIRKVFPEDVTQKIWSGSKEKLREILQKYDDLPGGYRVHTEDRIFPGAAVYLTLREYAGQETALKIMDEAAAIGCEKINGSLRKLLRLPGMKSFFVKVWDPLTRKMFGPGNGFENVFYPKEKDLFRMDILACPYCRYLTELGCPELTRMFCENDDRVYGNLPGIVFERTGTLGKGASRCDFLIKKE